MDHLHGMISPSLYNYDLVQSTTRTRLKQNTTVASYKEAFERLSHQVDGLLENFVIGCFTTGLRDDIRFDVKVKQPYT